MRYTGFLAFLLFASLRAGEVVFEEDFESGSGVSDKWASQMCHTWSFESRTAGDGGAPTPREGLRAARFELRTTDNQPTGCSANDPDKVRTEIASYRTYNLPGEGGADQWVGWAVWFPSDWNPSPTKGLIVFQIFGCTQDGNPKPCLNFDPTSSTFQGYYRDSTGNARAMPTKFSLLKGQWVDFVLHYKARTGSTGLFRLWQNGELVIEQRGSNITSGARPYLKVGMYTRIDRTTVIHYDSIKIAECADGEDCHDLVSPGASKIRQSAQSMPPSAPSDITLN